ncbi:unnamed protein product [Bubo scandiacus]
MLSLQLLNNSSAVQFRLERAAESPAQPPDEEDPNEGSGAAMLQAAQGDHACECRHCPGSPVRSRRTTSRKRLVSSPPARDVGVRPEDRPTDAVIPQD